MPDEFVEKVSSRYIELFEKITGRQFQKAATENILLRIETNVNHYLKNAPVLS
jgi:phosphoribosylaminoimidazole-succinocarboxamide synthase